MCPSVGSSNALFRRLDISDPASVDDFGAWAEGELHHVNILINNAGEDRALLCGVATIYGTTVFGVENVSCLYILIDRRCIER